MRFIDTSKPMLFSEAGQPEQPQASWMRLVADGARYPVAGPPPAGCGRGDADAPRRDEPRRPDTRQRVGPCGRLAGVRAVGRLGPGDPALDLARRADAARPTTAAGATTASGANGG